MLDQSRKTAKTYKLANADDIDHYLEVFEHCQQSPSREASDYIEKATLDVPDHVRGLEYAFVPSVKAARRSHSREVLHAQLQLLSVPEDTRLKLLATRASKSSRPSRLLARLIGDDDAEL